MSNNKRNTQSKTSTFSATRNRTDITRDDYMMHLKKLDKSVHAFKKLFSK